MRAVFVGFALLTASACGHRAATAPSGIPSFAHVFVIVMENTSLSTLQAAIAEPADTTPTPFLKNLATTAATASDYHGVSHPSLPNYLALVSGDPQGVACDCSPTGDACDSASCNLVFGSCGCGGQTAEHLGRELVHAGKSWRSYVESMGPSCNTNSAGLYAARHVPLLYFDDAAANCAAGRIVDYGNFAADLANDAPSLALITPNLTDDMHDPPSGGATNLHNGDTWLATAVPAITASAAFTDRGLLFIVWDEDDLSGLQAPDDPIPLFVVSPLARQGGFVSTTHADHYSLLATIEDGLAVGGHLGHAATATPLNDFFATE
jgi:phosphatidylinositol-3-phosphatase